MIEIRPKTVSSIGDHGTNRDGKRERENESEQIIKTNKNQTIGLVLVSRVYCGIAYHHMIQYTYMPAQIPLKLWITLENIDIGL